MCDLRLGLGRPQPGVHRCVRWQMGDVRASAFPSKSFRPSLAPDQSPGLPPPAPAPTPAEGRQAQIRLPLTEPRGIRPSGQACLEPTSLPRWAGPQRPPSVGHRVTPSLPSGTRGPVSSGTTTCRSPCPLKEVSMGPGGVRRKLESRRAGRREEGENWPQVPAAVQMPHAGGEELGGALPHQLTRNSRRLSSLPWPDHKGSASFWRTEQGDTRHWGSVGTELGGGWPDTPTQAHSRDPRVSLGTHLGQPLSSVGPEAQQKSERTRKQAQLLSGLDVHPALGAPPRNKGRAQCSEQGARSSMPGALPSQPGFLTGVHKEIDACLQRARDTTEPLSIRRGF